jgi:tripartite-type tricarboxylate transporter receptor subunit TctC
MRRQASVDAMRSMAVDISLGTPEEFGRLLDTEMQRWGKLVRTLKLRAD